MGKNKSNLFSRANPLLEQYTVLHNLKILCRNYGTRTTPNGVFSKHTTCKHMILLLVWARKKEIYLFHSYKFVDIFNIIYLPCV